MRDEVGDPLSRVAEPAAAVEHVVTLARRVARERRLAVVAQPRDDDVAVLDLDVEERAVPGLGRLEVVLDYADRVRHRVSVRSDSAQRPSRPTPGFVQCVQPIEP